MREVEFRGRRLDNGEWVYGDLCCYYENQRRFIACGQMFYIHAECGMARLASERFHEVDPATVGQYTGLRDENGREIYEGDIIDINCYSYEEPENHYHGEVVMGQEVGLGLVSRNSDGKKTVDALWNLNGSFTTEIYVHGNIHDNPELLEG